MSSGSEEEFDVGDDALAAVAPRAPSAAAAASRTATSQLDIEKPECDDNEQQIMKSMITTMLVEIENYIK